MVEKKGHVNIKCGGRIINSIFKIMGAERELTTTRKEGEREAGYKLCFCCFCFLLDISFCWIISNSSFKRGFCRR